MNELNLEENGKLATTTDTTILSTMVDPGCVFGGSAINKATAAGRSTTTTTTTTTVAAPHDGDSSGNVVTVCWGGRRGPRVAITKKKRLVAISSSLALLGIMLVQPAGGVERASTALYGGLFDSTSTIAYAEVSC